MLKNFQAQPRERLQHPSQVDSTKTEQWFREGRRQQMLHYIVKATPWTRHTVCCLTSAKYSRPVNHPRHGEQDRKESLQQLGISAVHVSSQSLAQYIGAIVAAELCWCHTIHEKRQPRHATQRQVNRCFAFIQEDQKRDHECANMLF